MTTTALTLNAAAKAARKSKSVLLDAIRKGKLSAERNEANQWQIEPCELFRVYPLPVEEQHQYGSENQDETGAGTGQNDVMNGYLKQKIDEIQQERQRERQQLTETITDLRERLDQETLERRKLMTMLVHVGEPQKPDRHWENARRTALIIALIIVATGAIWAIKQGV
jgi:hypothetical protein